MLDPVRIAILEETRQAIGTGELADAAEAIMGGVMARGAPGLWCNQACALALAGPVTADEIERLVRFYTDHAIEPKVEVCPYAHPSLLEGLGARGFVLHEFETVMARALPGEEELGSVLPHVRDEGLRIRRVDPKDPADVEAWVGVSSSGFAPAGGVLPPSFLEVSRRFAVHPRTAAFIAEVGGVAAGAGAMEVARAAGAEVIACMMGTSVLPEFRRRGVQLALMVERMRFARDRGAAVICIHSRPGIATERNARRLGFEVIYHKAVLCMPGPGLARSM